MKRILSRVALIIIFGIISFFPNYGLVYLMVQNFNFNPMLISVGGAFWLIVLSLILPLSMNHFKGISTLLICAILALGIVQGSNFGFIDASNLTVSGLWFIGAAFFVVAWVSVVATPLWRWVHMGLVTVQESGGSHDSDTADHHQ